MKNNFLGFIVFISSISLGAVSSMAQNRLSNTEIYYRCYAQLTQERPNYDDSLTVAVRDGMIDPIEACIQLMNASVFSRGNTQLDDKFVRPTDGELNTNPRTRRAEDAKTKNGDRVDVSFRLNKEMLRTVHNLHGTFFANKNFSLLRNTSSLLGQLDFLESSQGALYLTRSFFYEGVLATTALTGTTHLHPIRTDANPVVAPATNRTPAQVILDPALFSPKGDLLGVEIKSGLTMSFDDNGNQGVVNKSLHAGGGILGSISYLLQNIQEGRNYRPDGGLNMYRKWAKSVFEDLLCRELPVAREDDVLAFVEPTSSVPFRQSKSCVVCHASMDRMSSNIRNVKVESHSDMGMDYFTLGVVDQTPEAEWPTQADPLFHRRPASGTLFFRNYKGELIDLPTSSLDDLGQKISEQEDHSICLAKKYYAYFTGVDVHIDDPGKDGALPLGELDRLHREQVIELGLSLKNHKNPMRTVQEILRLPQYRQSDFGKVTIREFSP